MEQPPILRYATQMRYDRERGVVAALDWRGPAVQWAEVGAPEPLAQALAAGLAGDGAAYLAGYGLALAARLWAGRPSEARRAAIIQAGEWLRQARPADSRLAALVSGGVALADAAILAGGDAEAALIEYTAGAISRADRVAERCGRIAAGLLDESDGLLTTGDAGPALGWLLLLAGQPHEGRQLRVALMDIPGHPEAARWAVALAEELGVPVQLRAPEAAAPATVCMLGAVRIALDGSAALAPGGAAVLAQARAAGLPCYLLSYEGPSPDCPTAAQLGAAEVAAPAQVSAIITHRGVYRPEMIARFLGEGDPPLDVIPLS